LRIDVLKYESFVASAKFNQAPNWSTNHVFISNGTNFFSLVSQKSIRAGRASILRYFMYSVVNVSMASAMSCDHSIPNEDVFLSIYPCVGSLYNGVWIISDLKSDQKSFMLIVIVGL
jgi:hypothetical protein